MLIRLKSSLIIFCIFQSLLCLGQARADLKADIESKWQEIDSKLKNKDIPSANESLNDLENIKIKAGISELPEISSLLLAFSENYWAAGDKETAKFLSRKSVEFSPQSTNFLIEAMPCLIAFGVKSHGQVLVEIIKSALTRYDIMAQIGVSLIYPILWSLTFSALLCASMLFFIDIHLLLTNLKKLLPKRIGVYAASPLLAAFLILPLLGGPISTLILYAPIIYLLLPRARLLSAAAGVIIIFWAALIPIRENMYSWVNNPGIQTMLRVSSGIFHPDDSKMLAELLESRPRDVAFMFAYSKSLKREGNLDLAEKIIINLQKNSGSRMEYDAELGSIEFLKSQNEKADSIYKELEKKNKSDAAFLFNYSKIRFDLMDTEQSRSLYEQANKTDPVLINNLRQREEQFGIRNISSLAEFYLPLSYLLKSSLIPNENSREIAGRIADGIFPFLGLQKLSICGLILLLILLFVSGKKKPRRQGRAPKEYKPVIVAPRVISAFPGGGMIANQHVLKAAFFMTFWVFITLPLLNWPADFSGLLLKLTGFEIYYLYGYCFLIAALSYIGFSSYQAGAE
jgi:hypothetical protein